MLGAFLAAGLIAFSVFIAGLSRDQLAWGTASTLKLATGSSATSTASVLFNTWLANAPQFGLSIIYLTVNSYLTRLCSAHEWNRMATMRKGLRVTKPVGDQRSTHFLQPPYCWAIPLTVIAGILHWLLSQTLFLSRLEMRDGSGHLKPDESYCTCGYSLLSLIVLIAILLAGLAWVLRLSSRSWREKIPLAVNCSLVMSAACHPPPEDTEGYKKKVRWGVVPSRFGGIGHCSITGEAVTEPVVGKKYA